MSKNSTLNISETDWARIDAMQDEDIDLSDIPELTEEQLKKATLRVAGRAVSKEKVRVNMYLDAEIVEFFKAQAGGRGYQTLINETLKETMLQSDLESMLRRVIREELVAVGD